MCVRACVRACVLVCLCVRRVYLFCWLLSTGNLAMSLN